MSEPARSERPLRLVEDPEVARLKDNNSRLRRALDKALIDLENAEVDLKRKRAELRSKDDQIADLRRGLEERQKAEADYEVVLKIWECWRKHCRPKARKLDAKTVVKVKARLADTLPDSEEPAYSPRYLCEAILGAKHEAFVNPKTGKRYDSLELICRDPAHLEDFHERHERHKARSERGSSP